MFIIGLCTAFRYLGNYKELANIPYYRMRQELKKRPHILEAMGINLADFDEYDLDQIIPQLTGGPNRAGNLIVMHRSKNRSFGAQLKAKKVQEVGLKTWVMELIYYGHHHSVNETQIKLAVQSLVPWTQQLVSTAAAGMGSSAWSQSASLMGLYSSQHGPVGRAASAVVYSH
jgi:hypothetical protein